MPTPESRLITNALGRSMQELAAERRNSDGETTVLNPIGKPDGRCAEDPETKSGVTLEQDRSERGWQAETEGREVKCSRHRGAPDLDTLGEQEIKVDE